VSDKAGICSNILPDPSGWIDLVRSITGATDPTGWIDLVRSITGATDPTGWIDLVRSITGATDPTGWIDLVWSIIGATDPAWCRELNRFTIVLGGAARRKPAPPLV
jgi:hypothetical protein